MTMLQSYHIPKFILTLAATGYFFWCAADPSAWRLLDGVDLMIHEAGHMFLLPFGHFMHMIGGTLFQLLMPALFVFHFFRNDQPYSGALVLFWVGQNFLNISVYASDAADMKLPLLGGEGSIHDWNYMLITFGLLDYTRAVGIFIYALGVITIALAAYFAFKYAHR